MTSSAEELQARARFSPRPLPSRPTPQMGYLLVESLPPAARVRLPLNLCLILDRSSSMRGERLYYVKQAALHLLQLLHPKDRFALVVFDDRAEVLVPSQPAGERPQVIRAAIESLEAQGGTEMAAGLERGFQEILRAQREVEHGIHRILLLTDGRTYGDEEKCVRLVERLQDLGIGITVFGVGEDWNEDLLETLVAWGDGRSYFLESPGEIPMAFAREMHRLTAPGARSVRLELRWPRRMELQMQNAYRILPEIRSLPSEVSEPHRVRWFLGDWPQGERWAFLFFLVLPPLEKGRALSLTVRLEGRLPEGDPLSWEAGVLVEAASPNVTPEVDTDVLHAVRQASFYQAQLQAWEDLKAGNVAQATRKLELLATHLLRTGEEDLARTVAEEARRIQVQGKASPRGTKRILYGTRQLATHLWDAFEET